MICKNQYFCYYNQKRCPFEPFGCSGDMDRPSDVCKNFYPIIYQNVTPPKENR